MLIVLKISKNSIILCNLPGQSADNKVPSEIILDQDLQTVLAFGAECKDI